MTTEVYCIVEGYGEVQALPALLYRIQRVVRPEIELRIHTPHRISRPKLMRTGELERAVGLGNLKLRDGGLVLLLVDADDDLPCELGPKLLARMQSVSCRPGVMRSAIVANREFEAWFLAGYSSLAGHQGLETTVRFGLPEAIRDAKGAFERQLGGRKYSPPLDQPVFARRLDVTLTRQNSPSFDKLCRDFEENLKVE